MNDPPKMVHRSTGSGKGSGAAMVLFILGVAGTVMCLVFGRILKNYSYSD